MKSYILSHCLYAVTMYSVSILLCCLPIMAFSDEKLPEVAMPDSLIAPQTIAKPPASLPIPSNSIEPASPASPVLPTTRSVPSMPMSDDSAFDLEPELGFEPFALPALPIGVKIIAQHEWMNESASVDMQRLLPHSSQIQRITIHHTATPQSKNARLSLQGIQRYHQMEKGWADIAYHYLIAPNGKIYAGRNALYQGDSSTDYVLDNNLMIALVGNFEQAPPTAAALLALKNLVVDQLLKYKLRPEAVYTHGEQADTLCPGRYLKDWYVEQGKTAISQQFFASLPAS